MKHKQLADSCRSKRKKIYEEVRRRQMEGAFSRVRRINCIEYGQLRLSHEQESMLLGMNESTVLTTVLQGIENKDARVQIGPIKLYILTIQSFSAELGSQMVHLILSHHTLGTDIEYLNLAILVAHKCQSIAIANQTNLSNVLHCLLTQSKQASLSIITLIQLLCVILVKEQNKNYVLQAIQSNWQSLRQILKYDRQHYLQLAALCCHHAHCFIKEYEINSYLNQQYSDDPINDADKQVHWICRIVCEFFSQNKVPHLHGKLLSWMSAVNQLDLVSNMDREEMVGVLLFMFQHLQVCEKQQLVTLIVNNKQFSAWLLSALTGSPLAIKRICLQIMNYIILFCQQPSFRQFNNEYNYISKTALSLSAQLDESENVGILTCIQSILTQHASLLTPQYHLTLQQKLVTLSNIKALQNQIYQMLIHLDQYQQLYQC